MIENLPDFNEYFTPELVARFAEVNQGRSQFQIEKFVVENKEVPEMQYLQCLLELKSIYYSLKIKSLEVKKVEVRINKLRSSGDEIDEIDAQILELELEQGKVEAVGAIRELDILCNMLEKYPRYTREDIEKAQPEYWEKRLTNQYNMIALGGGNSGNLESLVQIGAVKIEATPIENIRQERQELE